MNIALQTISGKCSYGKNETAVMGVKGVHIWVWDYHPKFEKELSTLVLCLDNESDDFNTASISGERVL